MKKYLTIYSKIRNDIISGAIEYGRKLPSKRATGEKFSCSLITVEHAYGLLQSEGYIESKERSGYYASYYRGKVFIESGEETEKEKRAIRVKDENIPFTTLAKTYRYVLSEYAESVLVKSLNQGNYDLRLAIKRYLERNRNVSVDTDQIIIGSGAEYFYGLIIEFFPKNTTFAIENPSYKQIENVYKSKGAKYEMLSLAGDGISSADLNNTKAKVLHTTPYRSFPTGISASVSKKAEYIAWAEGKGNYIIEDDYESEFSLNGSITDTIFSMDNGNRVIYINTFTKTVCKSMRVGYMILPKNLLEKYREKLGFYSCTVPTLEQYVVACLLNSGTFERHLNKIRRQRKKELLNKSD
ncbi:MAG: PLP-dependent aminotransferase family protein [Clostridia bacterium]|nr:PLP-dependent aminotransferase family protein [Clostridia bacterium]